MNSHDDKFLIENEYAIRFGDFTMPQYRDSKDEVICYIRDNQRQLQEELQIVQDRKQPWKVRHKISQGELFYYCAGDPEKLFQRQWQAEKYAEEKFPRPVKVSRPVNRTQLWEPCERCGKEPSYVTPRGHLCERCAGD